MAEALEEKSVEQLLKEISDCSKEAQTANTAARDARYKEDAEPHREKAITAAVAAWKAAVQVIEKVLPKKLDGGWEDVETARNGAEDAEAYASDTCTVCRVKPKKP